MSEAPRKRAASSRKKEAEEAEEDDDDDEEEVEGDDDEATEARAAKKKRASPKTTATDKANTGLRHFSMKVCRKVEEKGKTTYNEVADELVKEVFAERDEVDAKGKLDEKNIRRRVYDALNVLMAMDIISKDKKDIRWKGLPSNTHHDLDMLQRERQFRRSEVERKRESLRELLVQQVCFRNLVQHNQRREVAPNEEKIPLPFIVVNTHSSAVIQCEMSPDRTDVMFDFSMPFEINDDNTILKRLGM
jgi:transcription factor Dp-1